MLNRTFALAIPLLLALLPASGHATDGITPRRILVGETITLQGGKNEYGNAVLAGVRVYLQAVTKRGGINGRQVELRTLDDDNSSQKSGANARQLVTQDKAFILFGAIKGGPSTAVMDAAVELKVPFFGPMAGSPQLRRPYQPLVFPVRADHLEEFRALLDYKKKIGATRVAFVRSDSETGRLHLENVRRLCGEMGMELVLDLPFKSDISDAQILDMTDRIAAANVQVVLNHGSATMYERLIRKARAVNVRAAFSGVNSGSAQLVRHLGDLAHGMVFSQVVPSPWERKSAITREYQEELARQAPGQEFSYGSLEGCITAKALVAALRLAGKNPTRESFVQGLQGAGSISIADGLRASYKPGDHAGLTLVDLAIVTREGKFRH